MSNGAPIRIKSLDALKAAAIITVSFNHTLDVILGETSRFQQWGYAWELFAFFFVGGTLLFHKTDAAKYSLRAFIKDEVKNIIWPYFTISIMYIILGGGTGWNQTVTCSGIGALWFLPSYFLASTLVFVLIKLSLLTRRPQIFASFMLGG